jgi:hypothetical protein
MVAVPSKLVDILPVTRSSLRRKELPANSSNPSSQHQNGVTSTSETGRITRQQKHPHRPHSGECVASTASTVWISTVRSQRRQETRSTCRWSSESFRCRIRASAAARGSFSTESQYSAGSGEYGAAAGFGGFGASAANFSICLGATCASSRVGRSFRCRT